MKPPIPPVAPSPSPGGSVAVDADVQNALENKGDVPVNVLRDVPGLKGANVEAVDTAVNVVLKTDQEGEDVPEVDQEGGDNLIFFKLINI